MSEGIPLPWPIPWFVEPGAATVKDVRDAGAFSQTSLLDLGSLSQLPYWGNVHAEADRLSQEFGKRLPAATVTELYLVQGVSEIKNSPDKSFPPFAVIYPPEFLFVLDVGLDCLVGGSVLWKNAYLGDPGFPEKRGIALRSIRARTPSALIFPKIAGELMIGLKEGTDLTEAKTAFSDFGLRNISMPGTFVTATCSPFQEPSVCRELEAQFEFVKYAEMNGVVRLVDFAPGWTVKRLM
ncbi:hypothetical protein [Rhizobium leguminosarum]|uniref:hypothetical protein n=1 Tax=Rhizobium leguminosarum TaxID=384 RepID=UPI0021BBC205|nr:hypothetical protein [Rhizobium leguminosarum]